MHVHDTWQKVEEKLEELEKPVEEAWEKREWELSYCWREHYQERGAPEDGCGRTQAEAELIKTGQTQLNGKVMRLNHEARKPGINRSHSNIIQRGDSHSAVLPINIYVGDWITRILEIRN